MVLKTSAQKIEDEWRHEIKFISETSHLVEIETWIARSDALFRPTYPPRRINNIYFDTLDLLAFDENLSGASSRTKVRLRWYGVEISPINPVLEIKHRKNNLGLKTLIPLKGRVDLKGRSWNSVVGTVRAQLSRTEKIWLDEFSYPAIINRYDRKYFESADGALRLTVDSGQAVYDQTRSVGPNLMNKINQPDTIVIELKFFPNHRLMASNIVQDIPLRRSRNSKYSNGVNAIYYQN